MRRYPGNNPMRPAVPSALVDDLLADWREHGRDAIRRERRWAPQRYVQLVAALALPGMSENDRLEAMSDEEFMAEYREEMALADAEGALPPFLRFVPIVDD